MMALQRLVAPLLAVIAMLMVCQAGCAQDTHGCHLWAHYSPVGSVREYFEIRNASDWDDVPDWVDSVSVQCETLPGPAWVPPTRLKYVRVTERFAAANAARLELFRACTLNGIELWLGDELPKLVEFFRNQQVPHVVIRTTATDSFDMSVLAANSALETLHLVFEAFLVPPVMALPALPLLRAIRIEGTGPLPSTLLTSIESLPAVKALQFGKGVTGERPDTLLRFCTELAGLECVECTLATDFGLDGLAQLRGMKALRRIAMRTVLVDLAAVAMFESLEELNIVAVTVKCTSVEASKNAPLRTLRIEAGTFADRVPPFVQALPELRTLDVYSPVGWSSSHLAKAIRNVTTLESVSFTGAGIEWKELGDALAASGVMSVRMYACNSIPVSAVVALASMRALTTLEICLGSIQANAQRHLSRLTNVRELVIVGAHTLRASEYMAIAEGATGLRRLTVRECSTFGSECAKQFISRRAVFRLHVQDCPRLGQEGLQELHASFPTLAAMR